MIQEIAPEVFRNQFSTLNMFPDPEDVVFCFRDGTILCGREEDGALRFPRVREFDEAEREHMICLFAIDRTEYFLYEDGEGHYAPADAETVLPCYAFEKTGVLREINPKDECFAGSTAFQLYEWYRDNRFCGRCAAKMGYSGRERAMVCPACGNTVYPKISPAVIIGLTDGDRIMTSRYAGRGPQKSFALLAGFCEIGETAEETVMRETMEEVGISCTNIRYYKSQPWGFASDLLLGFYCDATGSREITLDREELATAQWMRREDLDLEPNDVSLTAEMLQYFKDHPEAFGRGNA